MTDSIKDLLGAKNYSEPAEVKIIKQFLIDKFQVNCAVTTGPKQIIIGVNSASLAGALRLQLHELQILCKTQKRLMIRII